jgi:hypothetical protein
VSNPPDGCGCRRSCAGRDSPAGRLEKRLAGRENLAKLLPNARLVEPPWGDTEWNDRSSARPGGRGEGLFAGWPALAPLLQGWAAEVLG